MPRPEPTYITHFTRVEHLSGMLSHGLVPDNVAQSDGLQIEVGHTGIKEQRRRRLVPLPPGGTVADYVPFYFAPRSPMMYSIHRGNVPTYVEGCDRLIYVVTSLERLATFDIRVLLTDRNAALQFATFVDFVNGIPEGFIDWELMGAQYWNNTNDRPDRMERRMAECLVSPSVPWDAVLGVSAKSDPVADEARAAIAAAGFHTPVNVRPGWYF